MQHDILSNYLWQMLFTPSKRSHQPSYKDVCSSTSPRNLNSDEMWQEWGTIWIHFKNCFTRRWHRNSRKQNSEGHECDDFLEISGENITETDAIKLSSEWMHFYELKGEKYELQKSPNLIRKHILETQQTKETKEKHFQLSKQNPQNHVTSKRKLPPTWKRE